MYTQTHVLCSFGSCFCCPRKTRGTKLALAQNLWSFTEKRRHKFVTECMDTEVGLNKQTIYHMSNTILNRKIFYYSVADLLHYFWHCACLRSRNSLHSTPSFGKHWELLQGRDKVMRELDIVKVLKSVRDIRLMKEAHLTTTENMLMKFQKQLLIQTDESENEAEKTNFMSMIRHKNAKVRLAAIQKLMHVLKHLEKKRIPDEVRTLIDGLYKSRPKRCQHGG